MTAQDDRRGGAFSHPRRVGVIGYGSIGRRVAEALENGDVRGCTLAGVMRRSTHTGPHVVARLDDLIAESDLIIEAAGHAALRSHGSAILRAGADLLVLSVGALVDDELLRELRTACDGRLLLSTGALGGLDVLRAALRCGPLDRVTLESRKRPSALHQPWMDEELTAALDTCTSDLEVFTGTAREAARRFPQTANVAATLALATIGLDRTEVRLLAAPQPRSRHRVVAEGASGRYEITLEHETAPGNPRTSWITPFSVLRALEDLTARCIVI